MNSASLLGVSMLAATLRGAIILDGYRTVLQNSSSPFAMPASPLLAIASYACMTLPVALMVLACQLGYTQQNANTD